jgi:hypothetical protein
VYTLKITRPKLIAWASRWPCSTLATGTAYFDETGDLVDLTGVLARVNIDGHEFDAYCDDHQSPALARARGTRTTTAV